MFTRYKGDIAYNNIMKNKQILFSLVFIWCSTPYISSAEDWNQWRGPGGTSIVKDGDFPTAFSNEQNVLWKVALEGKGTSTPVTWGDRIFVTCKVDGEDGVVCLNWDGKEQWRSKLGVGRDGHPPSMVSESMFILKVELLPRLILRVRWSGKRTCRNFMVKILCGGMSALHLFSPAVNLLSLSCRQATPTSWHLILLTETLPGKLTVTS